MSGRAFKIHMSSPSRKVFPVVPSSRSSIKVIVKYQGQILGKKKKKTLTLVLTFERYIIALLFLTCVFVVIRHSLMYQGHLTGQCQISRSCFFQKR